MTIEQLIRLTENKLCILNENKKYHTQMGDVDRLMVLETEIMQTEHTLEKLKTLQSVD